MIIMNFVNPTKGKMSIKEVVQDIIAFMEEVPTASYKLIIGTDSNLETTLALLLL